MAKILVIGGIGDGHVNPMLPIIKAWCENGDEVHFYSTEDARSKVEATGAIFRPFANFLGGVRQEDISHFLEFIVLLLNSADQVVPTVVEQAQKEGYDYVFHDSLFGWGNLIARHLRLPNIASHASFASTGKKPKMAGDTLMKQVVDLLKGGKFIPEIKRLSTKFAETYGVPAPSINEVFCQTGQLNLVYTSTFFQPDYDRLDSSYVFSGPSISKRESLSDFSLDALKGDDRPVVYISMGTVLAKSEHFFQLCMDAFRDASYQVVISAGRSMDMGLFRNAPSHIIVRQYVPQLEVLQQATVFVSHGGMNSVSEALYYDVPLVLIPHAADQPIIAARVDQLGAGVVLNKSQLTAAKLRDAVNQVISEQRFKRSATTIGQSLRDAGGYRTALAAAERFRQEQGIK
ncbi:macrolide family glycosyltransferase [Gottfriedia luciferensis]|uniref:macrolide family glycosyltransferase n=1 Tax=Gottfriedia luciferensis TaxID=178774 RepID=UPI000B435B79|nr:macrolide family glycosyltransferase [Gottfriedia luciferensis]